MADVPGYDDLVRARAPKPTAARATFVAPPEDHGQAIAREDFAVCELCDTDGERYAVGWPATGIDEGAFTAMAEHLALRHTHLVLQVNVRDEAVTFTIGDDA